MKTISISQDLDLYFLGRNGDGHLRGVAILPEDDVLDIRPITSKGAIGRCSIPIPLKQVEEFVHMLRLVAEELQPPRPTSALPSVQDLIERYGIYGEHPGHGREDWRYLVKNGDT